MSGAGKSTVLTILAARGYRTVDLDDAGLTREEVGEDGQVEQLWDEGQIADLLDDPDPRPLVIAGCARNQGRFYGALDAVVLLDLAEEVMLERIATRTTNSFGRSPAERARILADAAAVLPLLRRTSTAVIDATAPADAVADAVEQHVRG